LLSFDDGTGPGLFAGGSFTIAGGMAANKIARWNGSSWMALGAGLSSMQLGAGSSSVFALAGLDGPEGPALIVGGSFLSALDSRDAHLARWQGCDTTPPSLSCPTAVSVSDPRSGPPGEVVTFTVSAEDDHDPSPAVGCVPATGSFFPPGITLVQCTATDAAGNQSNCSFPVNVIRKQPR
jgi:hypothetical protein